jgi:hypothetical protein
LATSVNTLTTGSQATVLPAPDLFRSEAGAPERASRATGTRIRTDVSARLFSRSEIVWVWIAGPATRVARSALAERLMTAADESAELTGLAAPCWPRSRPDATAPKVSERAIAAKIPFDIPLEIALEVKLEAEVALEDCAMFANPLAPWRSAK